MAEKSDFIKVMTPKFRVSFPNVFRAKAIKEGDEPKFSIAMLFDKDADLTEMKKAAMEALVNKWGTDKKKYPKGLRSPFRPGEEKAQFEGYEEGITFVTSNSKHKPGLVNAKREDIISEEDFYAGCYARATLLAFAYDTVGNRGVTFLLSNIQKLSEGESLSGKTKASDDFDAFEDDSLSSDFDSSTEEDNGFEL